MNYPLEIEKALLDLAAIDDQLKARRSQVRGLELEVTLDLCGAKDEDGKLILTNDKQREGAVARMLAERDDYNDLGKGVSNLERERRILEARLERLRMEFKLEVLAAEQRNYLAAMKTADAIFYARTARPEPEVELPF